MREIDESYTYVVECGDGTLYTGWAKQLEKRMICHNQGKGAKYTRVRLPVRLVHYEKFESRQEAMKREYAIKQLTRKEKLKLIEMQSDEVRRECGRIWEVCSKLCAEKKSDIALSDR